MLQKRGKKMIIITEAAAEKLKEAIAKRDNPQDIVLRVAFEEFG